VVWFLADDIELRQAAESEFRGIDQAFTPSIEHFFPGDNIGPEDLRRVLDKEGVDGLLVVGVTGVTTSECGEECHIFTGCRPVSCFRGNPLIAISVAGLGALLGAAQKATIRYNVVTSLRPR